MDKPTAILEAAILIAEENLQRQKEGRLPLGRIQTRDRIKRVLSERVPEKSAPEGEAPFVYDIECGYNQCRENLGL